MLHKIVVAPVKQMTPAHVHTLFCRKNIPCFIIEKNRGMDETKKCKREVMKDLKI